MPDVTRALGEHPCFGFAPSGKYGRLHLPVAPACNIRCAFCDRRYDCANESRPGVTSRVMGVGEALERARRVLAENPAVRVVGIAGPGDALANEATFETCARLHGEFPEIALCASTNGLLLPDAAKRLAECGLSTLTVTVNAATARTAAKIYLSVGEAEGGEDACRTLLSRQREGIARCAALGIAVKVNTVLIPGVNDGEVEEIARLSAAAGASVMNVMPLIPCGAMKSAAPPTCAQLEAARSRASAFLPQFRHCRQCRADAVGLV